jgi:hypothetical protein
MSEPPTLSLDDALTDVEARFIVTLPRQEIKQSERLFFHIEQAYWFYEVMRNAEYCEHIFYFGSLCWHLA